MAAVQRGGEEKPAVINELTMWQRGCAAGIASLVSSVFLNPIDVVKTRMQAQAATRRTLQTNPQSQPAWRYSPGPGLTSGLFHSNGNAAIFIQNAPVYRAPPQAALPSYRSSIDGLYKIARHEGLQSLWRGTDAAVLLTVPLVAIYLPLYDHLLEKCSSAGPYAPLVAGGAARAVAGFATAPLELARVRLQAADMTGGGNGGGSTAKNGILRQLSSAPGTSRLQRITSMWTGMGASLAKDVPFAALYWAMLEPLRASLMRHEYSTLADTFWQNSNINELPVVPDVPALVRERTPAEILVINIAAAGAAASLAAVVTTPFDVVKTKQQTAKNGKSSSIVQCLVKVYKGGGVRALFAGAGPRTTRTAAGYAIVTSLFEVFKTYARQSPGIAG
jgi:solute carrier family 25 protein 39/40